MIDEPYKIKSKRLRFIRGLMYLDALLIMISAIRLDVRDLSYAQNETNYIRLIILIVLFFCLYIAEKRLARYLWKKRGEENIE